MADLSEGALASLLTAETRQWLTAGSGDGASNAHEAIDIAPKVGREDRSEWRLVVQEFDLPRQP
jgi:hypothetical protein